MHFGSFSNTFCQKVWQDSEPSTAGRAAVPRVRHERSGSVGARRAEKLWLTHTSLRYFPIPVPRCVRADQNGISALLPKSDPEIPDIIVLFIRKHPEEHYFRADTACVESKHNALFCQSQELQNLKKHFTKCNYFTVPIVPTALKEPLLANHFFLVH